MIKSKSYTLKDLYLNKVVLNTFICKFWDETFKPLIQLDNKHLMLLLKIEYSDKSLGYRTLGHLRNVNFNDRELFIDYLSERLSILNDTYTSNSISKIIFTYIIKDGVVSGTQALLKHIDEPNTSWHRFNNMNLPISMDPLHYGEIEAREVNIDSIKYIIRSSTNKFYKIISNLNATINNITILGAADLKWTDTFVSEGCFKREIGKSTIYFLDGIEILRKQTIPSKPFRKTTIDKYLQEKFITFDIETIRNNDKLIPYLICAYNGSESIVSYADSNLDQSNLFKNFLDKLLTFFNKSSRLIIYAHNLSNFDGIFLLKELINYGEVKPLFFNGKLISIEVKLNVKGFEGRTLLFKDSYLLLPYPLRSLCNAFSIDSSKSYFPFNLSDINYTGLFPKFNLWLDITPKIYNDLKLQFKNKMWSFKHEAIKYCKLVTCGGCITTSNIKYF